MRDALTRECAMLHRYLLDAAPSDYVVEKYAAAHEHLPALSRPISWFDGFLLKASSANALVLRLVQAYVRIFMPAALVRKKAVLLLAIIECCAPSLVRIQASRTRGPAAAILLSGLTVAGFALELVLAAIVFAPIHVAGALVKRSAPALPAAAPVMREPA